jgi:hypothetical protein
VPANFHQTGQGLRFVFILETKYSDWFALFVANPKLCKDGLGYVHFNWCKSVSILLTLLLAVGDNAAREIYARTR